MKKVLGNLVLSTVVLLGSVCLSEMAQAETHIVQSGDSFFYIAQQYGVDPYDLAENNGLSIYDTIISGQMLVVPESYSVSTEQTSPSASAYIVQYGDSFSSIAARHGMDVGYLAASNGFSIDDRIIPGQLLQILGKVQTTSQVPSSYYLEGYDYEPGINYPVGQCTWAVQKLTGWAGDWWGNASTWATNAARDGYAVGTTPAVGAIAVWDDGDFGHVAYVTAVESDTRIQVLESNIAGRQWIDNHRGWFNPNESTGKISYIYAP